MPATLLRSRVSKISIIVLGGITTLVAGHIVLWHMGATATFERHANELRLLVTKQESRTIRRPILFDPAQPGDAWDSYAPILATLRNFPGTWTYPTPPVQEHARLLVAARPVLDGLRQAQSTEQLTYPPPFDSEGREDFTFPQALMGAPGILIRIAQGYHAQKRDADALDALVLLFGVTSDLRSMPGHEMVPMELGNEDEQRGFHSLREILEQHSLTSLELARVTAQLDLIRAARIPPYTTVARHGIYWRQQLIKWEREGAPGFPSPHENKTSWRYAFSARLGRATALNQIESFWKTFECLENLPSHQWMATLDPMIKRENSVAVAWPLGEVRFMYEQECACLRMWTSARVAMAIARFEVEQGRFPSMLTELIPQYLESVPTCPEGGEALNYKAGMLWCLHSGSRWKVHRRD